MEPKQSFIPKKPLSSVKQKPRSGSSAGLFFGISLIIFVISVGTGTFLYAYNVFLEKKVTNMNTSLERAKSAFEPSLIMELKRVNTRIGFAEKILDKHVAFSKFFKILEEDTLKSVRFKQFTYSIDNKGGVDIDISGEARDYSSIALQSDVFGDNKYIKNPIFSNLGLDSFGNITFNLTAGVDPSLVLYKNM